MARAYCRLPQVSLASLASLDHSRPHASRDAAHLELRAGVSASRRERGRLARTLAHNPSVENVVASDALDVRASIQIRRLITNPRCAAAQRAERAVALIRGERELFESIRARCTEDVVLVVVTVRRVPVTSTVRPTRCAKGGEVRCGQGARHLCPGSTVVVRAEIVLALHGGVGAIVEIR